METGPGSERVTVRYFHLEPVFVDPEQCMVISYGMGKPLIT